MKLKLHVSTVTRLYAGILCILASAGCASSGSHALNGHEAQCLSGVVRPISRDSLGHYQLLSFTRGSAVSPLGDAPSESDWDLIRQLSAERRGPCLGCVAASEQTGSVR